MILTFILALSAVVPKVPPSNPPAVNLTWTQSTSPNIASDCVYRGTQTGGPYTQINCSTTPSVAYQDTGVVRGNTYYYVVTAVNTSNVESVNSNEVQAIVPSVTPPTGLNKTVQ